MESKNYDFSKPEERKQVLRYAAERLREQGFSESEIAAFIYGCLYDWRTSFSKPADVLKFNFSITKELRTILRES